MRASALDTLERPDFASHVREHRVNVALAGAALSHRPFEDEFDLVGTEFEVHVLSRLGHDSAEVRGGQVCQRHGRVQRFRRPSDHQ
ncbi:MAG: hypothetical protein ABS52_15465 [Gemmatimonadetes bacterium SCN 70-22]|nr:MAG: hypothetical protein ABS52_15465 [Gemmatimonadetes bacterium SCN 70-22]